MVVVSDFGGVQFLSVVVCWVQVSRDVMLLGRFRRVLDFGDFVGDEGVKFVIFIVYVVKNGFGVILKDCV